MTDVEARRERYAAALADVRRAEADRSQLLTVLDAVADRFEASRRGGEPADAEAAEADLDVILADLAAVVADWAYDPEELAAVGLTAEGPRFDDFGVDRPADLPDALGTVYADGDEATFMSSSGWWYRPT